MEEKNYSTPFDRMLRIVFISLLSVIILYVIFHYDFLCATGIFLGFILGIMVIYGIMRFSEELDSFEDGTASNRRKEVSDEDMTAETERKRAADKWTEEQEADEDLAIAYEAMNDWEDFDNL